MKALSDEQLNRYERDGVLFPVDVLSDEEVSFFRARVESVVRSGDGSLRRLDSLHLFFPWAHRLVTHGHLVSVIESILGDDILVDGTLVFYKPPRDSSYVSWHQDSVYSGWHLTPTTSAWIALTASRQRNGCMRVIPGSHNRGVVAHSTLQDGANLLRRGERVESVDESEAVDVLLEPGQMSLHQSTIIHGSKSNVSEEPRIGFIVRFVTNAIANRERPILRVRGDGDCSHLILANPPSEEDEQGALDAWREAGRAKISAPTA